MFMFKAHAFICMGEKILGRHMSNKRFSFSCIRLASTKPRIPAVLSFPDLREFF